MSWIGRIRATFKRRSNPLDIGYKPAESQASLAKRLGTDSLERKVLENIDFREKYQAEKMKRIELEGRFVNYEKTIELLRTLTTVLLRENVKLTPAEFEAWNKSVLIESGRACPHCGSTSIPCHCQNDE